jgi:hypothetical protein
MLDIRNTSVENFRRSSLNASSNKAFLKYSVASMITDGQTNLQSMNEKISAMKPSLS